MWQDSNPYASQNSYYGQHQGTLQFYEQPAFYNNAHAGLEGNVAPQGAIPQANGGAGFGGSTGPWWTAFGTGGLEGEPPLLEGVF